MPKFEDKYVHFRWSDELEGKKVLCADHAYELVELVVDSSLDLCVVTKSMYPHSPFKRGIEVWEVVYYDPNYEAKVAHEQGKKIEFKMKGKSSDKWSYTRSPAWLDYLEYRVMSEDDSEWREPTREYLGL